MDKNILFVYLNSYIRKNKMKKIITIALATIAVLSACKKTTPTTGGTGTTGGSISNNLIAANWLFSKMTQTNGTYSHNNAVYGTYYATSSNPLGGMDLKSNGTYTSNVGYEYILTSIIDGDSITINSTIPQFTSSGNYNYDAATQKLSYPGAAANTTMDVVSLTSNQLVVSLPTSKIQVDPNTGETTESKNLTTFYYTK
jgi:hypothetical protein